MATGSIYAISDGVGLDCYWNSSSVWVCVECVGSSGSNQEVAMPMKLHPFYDVAKNMDEKITQGYTVYQQWNCEHCGAKQTMDVANVAYKLGDCEECGKRTDIEKNGMNFMATIGTGG